MLLLGDGEQLGFGQQFAVGALDVVGEPPGQQEADGDAGVGDREGEVVGVL